MLKAIKQRIIEKPMMIAKAVLLLKISSLIVLFTPAIEIFMESNLLQY